MARTDEDLPLTSQKAASAQESWNIVFTRVLAYITQKPVLSVMHGVTSCSRVSVTHSQIPSGA